MPRRSESDFAEVPVDRLFIESFANEQSPYHLGRSEEKPERFLERVRRRLKWHIDHSLSQRQKQVLKHYLSGKKEREIAQILGVKQQVVNIYKHRAIKKLHKLISL
jgi:RNA polymerase sigma factor (sigma-70 family)